MSMSNYILNFIYFLIQVCSDRLVLQLRTSSMKHIQGGLMYFKISRYMAHNVDSKLHQHLIFIIYL